VASRQIDLSGIGNHKRLFPLRACDNRQDCRMSTKIFAISIAAFHRHQAGSLATECQCRAQSSSIAGVLATDSIARRGWRAEGAPPVPFRQLHQKAKLPTNWALCRTQYGWPWRNLSTPRHSAPKRSTVKIARSATCVSGAHAGLRCVQHRITSPTDTTTDNRSERSLLRYR
jgi:hypothetical protein